MRPLLAVVLSSLVFSLSCTGSPSRSRTVLVGGSGGTQDQGGKNGEGKDGETGDTEIDGSTRLELLPEIGSKMRLMNGRALTAVYSRVFKEDADGFAHCEKTKPVEHTGCSLIFNSEERASMGLFDLYSERMSRGIQNVSPAEGLTLNYMRNLRAALGRECSRLVDREGAAPSADNLLVKDAAPEAEHLDAFVRRILDVPDKSVQLGMPFAEYVAAFETATGMGDPAKAKRNAYVNLCIALAMDPQIFMY